MLTVRRFLVGILALAILIATPVGPLHAAALRQTSPTLTLTVIGTYRSGIFGESAAEIVAFDPASARLFSLNAAAVTVDILDLSDPAAPTFIAAINATEFGAGANSVAVFDGLVAVAIEAEEVDGNGVVVFF